MTAIKKLRKMLSDPIDVDKVNVASALGKSTSMADPPECEASDALHECAQQMLLEQLSSKVRDELFTQLSNRHTLTFASGCTGTDSWSECGETLCHIINGYRSENVSTRTAFTCDKDRLIVVTIVVRKTK